METVPNNSLFVVTNENMRKTRQYHNLDVGRIKQSLRIIEDWSKHQPHLAEGCKHLNSHFLEQLFVISGGSIEKTKDKIDVLLTYRGKLKDIVCERNVQEFEEIFQIGTFIPLPKLTAEQSRIYIFNFLTEDLDSYSFDKLPMIISWIVEYKMHYDYSLSETCVIDLRNLNFAHLSKIDFYALKQLQILAIQGFGNRIKGIHFINNPTFMDILLQIYYQVTPKKIQEQIQFHLHNTYEDLYKHVPREILPEDYGGDEKSCNELKSRWIETFKTEEAQKIFDALNKLVADETMRPADKLENSDVMGIPGSFRQLALD